MTKFSYDIASRIKSLKELGVPIAKIARKWNLSRPTIYAWLARLEKEMKTSA